ncbi:centromere protein C isoform X2 [Pleurodeles waltl]|uniref:centromere protein C isoform X2 n=1 Tax=Pleurodeles waltl TaxID=8319 RepID=UPI00370957D6
MCSALDRFRNEYRTRYCKTESARQNLPARGADGSSRDMFKNLFVDRIEAEISTVDRQPLICSTPISVNSRTAALNQNKQELEASPRLAGFLTIPIRESLGKSSNRNIQAICRPVEADISTVDAQPLICSTPINLGSRTAALNQNKQELVASPEWAGFVKIPKRGSLGKSPDRNIQGVCRPESEQTFSTSCKYDIVPELPGLRTEKGNRFLERDEHNMFESDDEKDVEADKGEAILFETDAQMPDALLEPNNVERPQHKLYACDSSAVVQQLSPTMKLQARKRLSFKDKETPFGSRTPASELTKHSQPEVKIRETSPFIKIPVPSAKSSTIPPSVHNASEKDMGLRLSFKDKETPFGSRTPASDLTKHSQPEVKIRETSPFIKIPVPSAKSSTIPPSVHNPSEKDMGLRISVKDKETPFERKTPQSELTKQNQPEDNIMQTPPVTNIPPPSELFHSIMASIHTALKKDTKLRNHVHMNETQHTLNKRTADKVDMLKNTQDLTDSQETIRGNEKNHGNCQSLNEKCTDRFTSIFYKTMHPENKLSKGTLHSSHLPCPQTTEYNMEEEFEINEASSLIFKSWTREFKNVKPSSKQPITAAAERKKCVDLEQEDTKELDFHAVDAAASNFPLCSSRKKASTKTKQVRALANAKELSSLQQQNKKNIALVKAQRARQIAVQSCVTYDNHSSTVTATNVQLPNMTVSLEANLPTEVEECSNPPVSKNQSLLKKKAVESQVKAKISSAFSKKTKKGFGVGPLQKEQIKTRNIETSTHATDRLTLGRTPMNENNSTHVTLPQNVLADTLPEKMQENTPKECWNEASGQILGRKMLTKNKSVNSLSEIDKNQDPPVKTRDEDELTSNLSLKDRDKFKEKQLSQNQADGDTKNGVLDMEHLPSPLSDDWEKMPVPEPSPSQNVVKLPSSVSKRGRKVKPASTTANPEKDLLTSPAKPKKRVSRKLNRSVSSKKQVNKNQAAGGSQQRELEMKHVMSPLQDNSKESPVLKSQLSQDDKEAPPSLSKRGRTLKPASAWWAVNPDQDLLSYPAKAKRMVSRKFSEHFSKRAASNKKIKGAKISKTKSHQQVKINNVTKIDSPADLDGMDRLVETNTAKGKTNEQLGSMSENTEMQAVSEYRGKKRKVDDVLENNEVKQKPMKIKKSILKVSSKHKCPISEERTERFLEEEEPENPKREEGFALPPKVKSRVSALRKSLLPPMRTQRLSSFKGSLETFGAVYVKTPVANTKTALEIDPDSVTPGLSPTKSPQQTDISQELTVKEIRSKSRMPVCTFSEGNLVSENENEDQLKDVDQIENIDLVLDVAKASLENPKHDTHEKLLKRSCLKENSSEDAENLEEDPRLYTHDKNVTKIHSRGRTLRLGHVLEEDHGSCKYGKPAIGSVQNERCTEFVHNELCSEVAAGLHQKADVKKAKLSCQKEHFLESVNALQEDLEVNTHVKNIKTSYCKEVPEHMERSKPNNNNLNHNNTSSSSSSSDGNVEEGTMRINTQSHSDYSENSSSRKEDSREPEQLTHMSEQFDRILEKKNLGTFDKNINVVTPQKKYFNRFPGTARKRTGLNNASKMAHQGRPSTELTAFELPNSRVLLTPSASVLGGSHCIQSGSGPVPSRTVRMISHKDQPVHFDLCQSDLDSADSEMDTNCTFVIEPAAEKKPKIDLDSTDSETDTNCTFVIEPAAEKKHKIVLPSQTPNLRRSKRVRVPPLDFWRGERVEYKPRPSGGFVVDGIISPDQNVIGHRRVKAITKIPKGSPKQDYVLIPAEIPPTRTQPTTVVDAVDGNEIYLDCVKKQDECVFASAEGFPAVCKSLIQPMFSSGEIILSPLQEKGFSFVHFGCLETCTISKISAKNQTRVFFLYTSKNKNTQKLKTMDKTFVCRKGIARRWTVEKDV